MVIFTSSDCTTYRRSGHPERPERISATLAHLQAQFPDWKIREPERANDAEILRVHSVEHLTSFTEQRDFDADTAWLPGILDHATRAAGGAVAAMRGALAGEKCFSLLRPPGHHASRDRAMGFCYLNSIVIAAEAALAAGVEKVAIWDFDAHHGNGTEDLVAGDERLVFASVHQSPGWPGSGADSLGNARNYPVAPMSSRRGHMEQLRNSLDDLLAEKPGLLLVSAGFDAYAGDPITEMTLLPEDFAELGAWLAGLEVPVACVLEGGYSAELPLLIGSFLEKWSGR